MVLPADATDDRHPQPFVHVAGAHLFLPLGKNPPGGFGVLNNCVRTQGAPNDPGSGRKRSPTSPPGSRVLRGSMRPLVRSVLRPPGVTEFSRRLFLPEGGPGVPRTRTGLRLRPPIVPRWCTPSPSSTSGRADNCLSCPRARPRNRISHRAELRRAGQAPRLTSIRAAETFPLARTRSGTYWLVTKKALL